MQEEEKSEAAEQLVDGASSPRRLIIADDHALVREGLRSMLEVEPDLWVIAEAENGRECVELCADERPDLVLMDVRMPKMDGLAATRALKAQCPKTAVLIVTTHDDPDYLLEAIQGGAAGYVLKDASHEQLLAAVRQVLEGESPLDQALAMQLLKRLAGEERRSRSTTNGLSLAGGVLTPRELDVVGAIAGGGTNRQIADALHVSLSTVKGHLERITNKLGVSDRTQVAVKAIQLGLVNLE